MARPTSTRAELRRAIGRELKMPFFRRFTSARTGATSSGGVHLIDSALVQVNDFWNGAWLYCVGGPMAGETRLITDFVSSTNTATLEYTLGCDFIASSDEYEIHSLYSPLEIHDAINRAIKDGFPYFYETTADQTLVLQEDKLSYDISGLTTKPWIITRVFVETSGSRLTGTATAGAAGSITDSKSNFTGVAAGWLVSIYSGTGAGQLRTVGSLTGTTVINVTVNWTTTPDTTSKFCVWNPSEEITLWQRLSSVRLDASEYPSTMFLNALYSAAYGMRIRIEFMAEPAELTTDASTTVVPAEFIINRALAVLFAQGQRDSRADLQRYRLLAEDRMQKSEQYMRTRAFPKESVTRWMNAERGGIATKLQDNPLDW